MVTPGESHLDVDVTGAFELEGEVYVVRPELKRLRNRIINLSLSQGAGVRVLGDTVGKYSLVPLAAPQGVILGGGFTSDDVGYATSRGVHQLQGSVIEFACLFRRLGAEVLVRPSPWRLGPADSGLIAEWFSGWVGAAREQDPALSAECEPYTRRRLEQANAGELTVTVAHSDLLILP